MIIYFGTLVLDEYFIVLVFPFLTDFYYQILVYLRLCLTQSLEVPLTREIIKHPTDVTPTIRNYLQGLYNEKEKIEKNALLQYLSLIKNLLIANPGLDTIIYFLTDKTTFISF